MNVRRPGSALNRARRERMFSVRTSVAMGQPVEASGVS